MGRDSVKTKAGRRKGKLGARWQKGQSCVSNPETKKYRDEASSMYYHQVKSNPLLTASNLQSRGLDHDDIEDDVLSEDIQSLTVSDARSLASLGMTSLGSYKSFASDWSKCSNKAFERFLSKCKLDSAIHKDMLSILAATSEIINSMGGTHKETEYFASFITALEKCEKEQYHPMLALLAIVVGKIPKPILRRKFCEFHPKIGAILEEAMDAQDSALIRLCCDILRRCIAVQEPNVIESERPIQTLIYSILKCAVHDNPKVRKKARWGICFIMEEQNNIDGQAATFLVVGWVLDQLSSYPACGAKTVVDALSLLQHIWPNIKVLPSAGAKKLFEAALRVMSSGDISILKIGFMFFVTMFQTGSVEFSTTTSADRSTFVDGLNAKLVTAVWEFKPNWRNEEVFVNWLQCVLNGLVKLSFEDPTIGHKYIPLIFDTISLTWSASFGAVTSKILTDFLPHLISPEVPLELIENSFQIISKNLITLPPNQNCLFVLAKFLECLTPSAFCESAKEVLIQLIPLRTLPGVENILKLFVTGFGIENVWKSVEPEVQRTIILPLVRASASNEKFQFWKENILTLLSPDSAHASMKFLVWDSLVGFCKNPSDPINFPAELLGKTIVGHPDVRLSTLAALRQILKWDQAKSITTKYTVNYLPILFNLYVKEKCSALGKKSGDDVKINDGHAEAVATTIQEYLPFCSIEFTLELTQKAFKKYADAPNNFEKSALLDLLTFLVSVQTDEKMLQESFSIASSLINDAAQMKRAYRMLGMLIKNETVPITIKSQVADLLRASKGKTKSNAEPFRLECITSLALQNDGWFTEFLPEAILNLLSVNMKARKSATKFITSLVDELKEKGATLENMMDVINLGLNATNSFTCACTIHFLSLIYRPLMPASPPPQLLSQCIRFVLDQKDATVAAEAFRFISLTLSLHKGNMGTFAGDIGRALAAGGLPRKETNKMLAQLIKIFGAAGLKAILPNSNDLKMQRRIKNIQRKLKKMKDLKREKIIAQDKDTAAGSDEEDYTDEVLDSWTGSKKGSKQEKLLMKEDLVDFLDPHNITASLISKPKEAKKDDQFEVSADGKLIIQEKSKSGVEELDSDDEEEYDELFKKPEVSRKRKLKSSAGSTTSTKRSTRSFASSSSRGTTKSMRSTGSASSMKARGGHVKTSKKANAKRSKMSKGAASVRSSRY